MMPGTYNISLIYSATQNYTGNSTYHMLTVNDTRAPWITLIGPPDDGTDVDGDLIFNFNVNDTGAVQNCSLYVNATRIKEKKILTKGENTFTMNGLGNGNYTWYVNCSDFASHTNVSEIWNFTVDINEFYPTLTPVTCSDDSGGCTANNLNNTPGVWEEHGILEKGATQTNYVYVNFTQANISAGSTIHWMYIYYDKYQDTTSGFMTLEWLNGSTWVTICNTNYVSGGVHVHDAVNCSFSNSTMPDLSRLNIGLQLRAEFYYSGTAGNKVYGTDETYINLKYTEDVTPPTVELVGPSTYHKPGSVNFTYVPVDANLENCTLYGNFNGTWASNITDPAVQSDETGNLTIKLDEGFYTWNVYCCDIAGNCAFDKIGGPKNNGNYTVNITNPDLIVSSIQFNKSDSQTREGMNITINATILNQGNVNVTKSFNVSFFLGDPDSGGTQINGNKTINGLNVGVSKTVNVSWIIDSGGPRAIFVIVDPPLATNGSVKETVENNNKNNKTLHVPAYNYFYGDVENNLLLADQDNVSFYYYFDIANVSGNILVTDEECSISFGQLQAIGRDINNNSVSNDFNDTDSALGMTAYNDSIRWIYTHNTDIPLATKTMTLYNKQINNIPVVNSTNTSSFQTGLLWDMGDGGTQYTGAQDLVLVTEINQDKTGAYDVYDYEIRVPTNLKNYAAVGSNVDFYWEITESIIG
jgi:hypothetical protein